MTRETLSPISGISVICPVKDLIKSGRSASFQRLVESYVESRCEGTELIIVEGTHADQTDEFIANILQKYPYDQITSISEVKPGIYPAINKGARAARKNGLIFLGSDDYFLPNGLTEIFLAAALYPAEYYYWTQAVLVDTRHDFQRPKSPSRVLFGNFFCFQSFLIRKDVFRSMGGFSEEFSICSDYDLAFKLVQEGRIGKVFNLAATVVDRNGESSNVEKFKAEFAEILSRRLSVLLGDRFRNRDLNTTDGRVKSIIYIYLAGAAPNGTLRTAALRGLARNLESFVKGVRIA